MLAANVYWIVIKKDVQKFFQECDTCQCQNYIAAALGGLLQPLPAPDQNWDDLSMDFITGLPKSKGYDLIFGFVDRLSKYSHIIPLKHPYTAKQLA